MDMSLLSYVVLLERIIILRTEHFSLLFAVSLIPIEILEVTVEVEDFFSGKMSSFIFFCSHHAAKGSANTTAYHCRHGDATHKQALVVDVFLNKGAAYGRLV